MTTITKTNDYESANRYAKAAYEKDRKLARDWRRDYGKYFETLTRTILIYPSEVRMVKDVLSRDNELEAWKCINTLWLRTQKVDDTTERMYMSLLSKATEKDMEEVSGQLITLHLSLRTEPIAFKNPVISEKETGVYEAIANHVIEGIKSGRKITPEDSWYLYWLEMRELEYQKMNSPPMVI